MATDLLPGTTVSQEHTQPTEASTSGIAADATAKPTSALTSIPGAVVVLDKLASLDVARKAERERRREESRATADPRESVARFLQGFTSRHRTVEDALKRMLPIQQPPQPSTASAQAPQSPQQQHQQPNGAPASTTSESTNDSSGTDGAEPAPLQVSTATPELVQSSLELLSKEVVSLEQSAAAASYYLPAYDQKQCAAAVAALRAAIDGARATLAPRRKFAFGSKKVSKVRGEDVSSAAAASTGTGFTTAAAAAAAASRADSASLAPGSSGAALGSDPTVPGPAPPAPGPPPGSGQAPPGAARPEDGLAADEASPGRASSADDALSWVSEQDRALVARGRGLLDLSDATVVLRSAEVSEGGAGGDFVLLGLTRCRVVLLGRLRALRVARLRSCEVVVGPVTGACFVDDVRDSKLSLATYQVRIHRTHATDLFLRVRSKPIIEHSTGVRVAPWPAAVAPEPRLDQLLQAHMLGEETGCWQQVDDFGWIKAVQSPNWSILPPEAYPRERILVPEAVWQHQPHAESGQADGSEEGRQAEDGTNEGSNAGGNSGGGGGGAEVQRSPGEADEIGAMRASWGR